MLQKVSENSLDVLKNMEAFEKGIAELYLTCSQRMSFNKESWLTSTAHHTTRPAGLEAAGGR